MQPTTRKAAKLKNDTKNDETPSTSKKEEKKLSTPRNFAQKSTSDIYGQKKQSVHVAKTPKKLYGTTNVTKISPMKDLLKQSPASHRTKDTKTSTGDKKVKKELPFLNVTVNSPRAKSIPEEIIRNNPIDKNSTDKKTSVELKNKNEKGRQEEVSMQALSRQRTKTRTLDENEVKVLKQDIIDNNKEMMNLSQKLKAKPKAFFIDLADEKMVEEKKDKNVQLSDEDVSYEDDFESYESDFESYHSDEKEIDDADKNNETNDADDVNNDVVPKGNVEIAIGIHGEESHVKDIKDEERMLDSGSYDLRDRSAKSKPSLLEHILEDSENPNDKPSFTDEGFQEMSTSSAVSSLKTVHLEVIERPFFIDFTKSKENKRKRFWNESLKQRAKDLLAMITLHEMNYLLFEMKPVSYDLYMATFGRNNYTQTAVQTFEDGVDVEIQTNFINFRHIWTQHPVEFSKSKITFQEIKDTRKYSQNTEEFIDHFRYLIENKNKILYSEIEDLNFASNPLRIYLEQKDGVGETEMLPYHIYKNKIKSPDYNEDRLKKFLKKSESRISNILNFNTGNTKYSDLKKSRLPRCEGYFSLSNQHIEDEKYSFFKQSKINKIVTSHTKNDLIITICNKRHDFQKCVVCLWDLSISRKDPVKILIAIDNINIGVHTGNTDGIFIAALDDGSLHLWDLSEEPSWWQHVASDEKITNLVEIKSEEMSEMERDREWNLKNSNVVNFKFNIGCALQSCAYTNSGHNLLNEDAYNLIVGLDICPNAQIINQDGGRKVIGQVATLQPIGRLVIWSVVQEKKIKPDVGKAHWSKLKLEKLQNVILTDYIEAIIDNSVENKVNYNLAIAKRRLMKQRQERTLYTRPNTAVKFDRPTSAAIKNKSVLPAQNNLPFWDNVICNDIKVVRFKNVLMYIVAKNNGEVLCCRRIGGVFKVDTLKVSNDTSSVTNIATSPHNLPYFLAATGSGTVHLCSLIEKRVLLTLDSRNVKPAGTEKCISDQKGQYTTTVPNTKSSREDGIAKTISVSSVHWSHVNPCCFYALLRDGALVTWDLTQSDIYAKIIWERVEECIASDNHLVLLVDGEIQIHKLKTEGNTKECIELFKKYIALL